MNKNILALSFLLFVFMLGYGLVMKARTLVPASTVPLTKKTIIIDAGHGIPDKGAASASGIYESDINLKIAMKLKKLLQKSKVNVIMTREDENSLSDSKTNNKRDDLAKRVKVIKESDADLFISIHLNHFSEPKYSGAQVFYNDCNTENEILAKSIQESLVKLADPENTRDVKVSNDIFILKNSGIPSVLTECGFLSNPEEAELMNTKEYQDKLAWAIYCGVCDYFDKKQHTTIY